MSQILWKNSFGKGVFPFWRETWCREISNSFLAAILKPYVRFSLSLGSFGVLYHWPQFQRANHSGKCVSEVGPVRTPPPLTTNGSAEDLDHLSVKKTPFSPTSFRSEISSWVFKSNHIIMAGNPIPLSPQKHETASQSGPAGPLAARTELNRWTAIREGPIYMGPAGP